jgi:hypothetical protein
MRTNSSVMFAIATIALASCGKHDSTAPVPQKDILVSFDLSAADIALVVGVDGTYYGTIVTSEPTEFHIPGDAKSITYQITKSPLFQVSDITSDIIGATATADVSGSRYTINNVFGGVTYVNPFIQNNSGATAYVGIFRGGTLTCIAPMTVGALFGQNFGFWRLTADTELRAYQSLGCTGSYHAWTNVQLSQFTPDFGLVNLTLTTIP